jgi:hypothetical protein
VNLDAAALTGLLQAVCQVRITNKILYKQQLIKNRKFRIRATCMMPPVPACKLRLLLSFKRLIFRYFPASKKKGLRRVLFFNLKPWVIKRPKPWLLLRP